METVTINKRKMTVTSVEKIEGDRVAADIVSRGYEPAFYTLTGPRGGSITCFKSIKTGQFSEA